MTNLYKIPVAELKGLLEAIDELDLNDADKLKVKTVIHQFANQHSILSQQMGVQGSRKISTSAFWQAMDKIVPPSSSKQEVGDGNIEEGNSSLKAAAAAPKKKAPKKKAPKPKKSLDELFEGIDDEIMS